MNTLEQARRYLAAIPPAIAGQHGHDQTFIAARALIRGFNLPEADAWTLLKEWNLSCQPPWSDKDLGHKLREAATRPMDKPQGWLLSARHSHPTPRAFGPPPTHAPAMKQEDPVAQVKYDLQDAEKTELPKPIENGFETLLRTCYQPGEGVRIMHGFVDDPDGGVILTREEWLAKLENGGNINFIFKRLGGPQLGVYIGMNPMKLDGRGRDGDVTSYRYTLIEFDEDISLEEQWLLYQRSKLPCAAIIYSGGKSIHAWVKIQAKDRQEYDERVNLVYNHFASYRPDPKNKNPARLSRCPEARRGERTQDLLAIDCGAENFNEWSVDLLVQGIGTTYSHTQIHDHNPYADGNTVAGDLWLRKGAAAMMVGPSGVGKSSLAYQIGATWALGRPAFGITPSKALKVLLIQAENDLADLHTMDVGILQGLGAASDSTILATLHQNFVVNHNVTHTGRPFIEALQKLIDHHEPDLVIIDPLLSFMGTDVSKQEFASQFCRNWLNPVLLGSGVALLVVHHTGKPAKQKQPLRRGETMPTKTMSEWSYEGLGSSELVNWARAIMVLNEIELPHFELLMTKRGNRAGAKHPNGTPTQVIQLQHHPSFTYWQQNDPTELPATAPGSLHVPGPVAIEPVKSKPDQVATANLFDFLSKCPKEGESNKEIRVRLGDYAANKLGLVIRGGTLSRALEAMVANGKLGMKEGLYIKGPNA